SAPLRALAACLAALAQAGGPGTKPTLILNGDILELALAGTSQAAMNFVRFMEALAEAGAGGRATFPFADEVYYVPGNHDHHLWNTARETQYINHYIAKVPASARGERLKAEYQATNMFLNGRLHPVPAFLLNALFAGRPAGDPLAKLHFSTVYPNFGLLNLERTRAVLFHHGHYVEPIYRLMSGLKDVFFPGRPQPERIWGLEAENGAWVDFFWSTLGRSGAVGEGVELIYDKMQDQARFDVLLDRLAGALAPLFPPRGRWAAAPKRALLGLVLRRLAAGRLSTREVHQTGAVLSVRSQAGLTKYVSENLLPEIRRGNGNEVPGEVTFVFGHTHKPFERRLEFPGYPGPVAVFNSGGWVADTLVPEPLHGGAVVVVDDALEVASLRLYHEAETDAPVPVEVRSLADNDPPLCRNLRGLIDQDPAPWATLSASISAALPAHRENLRRKVDA
ncbi:MAG TPA: hypothetical protein VGD78_19120, partial [Chthoniobacterales bacterium]